jgi:NAD(P)-dependent dehydrogenase (short-subunit alcohol dehydrogenase family)
MKLKPIDQQVVVVMGASSGIGRETAIRFAKKGAKLVVSARSKAGLDSLVDEINTMGGEATAVVADVTDFDQVKAVADRAVREYGQLDTWVHLAAVSIYATFENTRPEEFRRIIDVNLVGQAYGAMAALPHLRREGRGALIHISSIEGKCALPFQSAYASSKHGVVGFLDSLRMELKKEGVPISVTNVMPAGINTPFFNKALTRLGVKPMPVPPIYQPDTVADVILYAAENPVSEIIAGGAGEALLLTKRISPRLMDAILMRMAFNGQKTDEPKSEDAPSNLFEPIMGYNKVYGDFINRAKSTSIFNWLETHPIAGLALVGTAFGAATMLTVRAMRR